jgi:hypothetical protein
VSRPGKHPDLISEIRACVDESRYFDTRHAAERQSQRQITRPGILFVLKYGHHEKAEDKFDEAFKALNYSVRGRTVDRRELRIIVSFDQSGMLIITAIELEKVRK